MIQSPFLLVSLLYNVTNRFAKMLVAGILYQRFFLNPKDVATSLKHRLHNIKSYF